MEYLIKANISKSFLVKCSITDHFVARTAVSVAFYYHERIPKELIMKALPAVLDDFPIFSGILVKQAHQLYIHCNNNGVKLKIRHFDRELSSNLEDNPYSFIEKINPAKLNKPVLHIQLNYFKNGMVIGYCWHHSIGDIATFMTFLKALSAKVQNTAYPIPVLTHDREAYLQQWSYPKTSHDQSNTPLKLLSFFDILKFVKQRFSPRKRINLYFSENDIVHLKRSIQQKSNHDITSNSVLCAYLFDSIKQCRNDNPINFNASIVINYRNRIGMSPHLLGNYLDAISIQFKHSDDMTFIANMLAKNVKHYASERFNPTILFDYFKNNGGIKKINRMIPFEFLPERKNLILSSWCNYDIYSIDFGIARPFLFIPLGDRLMPWVGSVFEGYNNRGKIVSIDLPRQIAHDLNNMAAKYVLKF